MAVNTRRVFPWECVGLQGFRLGCLEVVVAESVLIASSRHGGAVNGRVTVWVLRRLAPVSTVCVNSSEFFRVGRSAQRPSRKINRATRAAPENLRPGAEPQSGRGDARRMQRRRRGRSRRPGPFPRTSPPNLVTRPCGLDPHVARVRSVSELNMLQLAANCQRSRVGGHLQRSAQRKRLAF
jgi:hypothetical protein